jgi:hypothetical protein
MLNVLGLYDASIMCADLLRGSAAPSSAGCRREFISIADVNTTLLLQCLLLSSPPQIPLLTCKALMPRIKRHSSSTLQLLLATVACQAASAHLHSASLTLASPSAAAADDSVSPSLVNCWSSLRACWFSYSAGLLLLLLLPSFSC